MYLIKMEKALSIRCLELHSGQNARKTFSSISTAPLKALTWTRSWNTLESISLCTVVRAMGHACCSNSRSGSTKSTTSRSLNRQLSDIWNNFSKSFTTTSPTNAARKPNNALFANTCAKRFQKSEWLDKTRSQSFSVVTWKSHSEDQLHLNLFPWIDAVMMELRYPFYESTRLKRLGKLSQNCMIWSPMRINRLRSSLSCTWGKLSCSVNSNRQAASLCNPWAGWEKYLNTYDTRRS